MTDEKYIELAAQIKAIELITRGLFAKWARESPDPQASAFRLIETAIGSLHSATSDAQPEQLRVISMIEDRLREFGHCVEQRLADLMFPSSVEQSWISPTSSIASALNDAAEPHEALNFNESIEEMAAILFGCFSPART